MDRRHGRRSDLSSVLDLLARRVHCPQFLPLASRLRHLLRRVVQHARVDRLAVQERLRGVDLVLSMAGLLGNAL